MTKTFKTVCGALLALGCAQSALATATPAGNTTGSFGPPYVDHYSPTSLPSARQRAFNRLRQTMLSLRAEALSRQAANGGQLSNADRALIQVKLDVAHARYREYQNSAI